jgi:hypothetical protein
VELCVGSVGIVSITRVAVVEGHNKEMADGWASWEVTERCDRPATVLRAKRNGADGSTAPDERHHTALCQTKVKTEKFQATLVNGTTLQYAKQRLIKRHHWNVPNRRNVPNRTRRTAPLECAKPHQTNGTTGMCQTAPDERHHWNVPNRTRL